MREVLPAIAFSLDDIRDNELAEANRFFSRGKFVESLAGFRTIIQKLLLVVAKDESEATDVSPFPPSFSTFHSIITR
jgi:coatomer protein complex subunit alpha (xenin)